MLDESLLTRIHNRAAEIDRTNEFPHEDIADLRAAGYFTALVPKERGGGGLSLREMVEVQLQLAGAAPATALAVNMHQVWCGVANTMAKRGKKEAEYLWDAAVAGHIFAFGISERGNDLVLFGSDTQAVPDGQGGYRFTGTKIFTSLAPVWTMLGTFGLDTSGAEPQSVYAFVERDGAVRTMEDWDALGMRASQSCTTVLDGAHAPAERVLGVFPPGPTMEPVVFGIFANFEILLAAVYTGLAQRALEVAVATTKERTSKLNKGAPYSNDPAIRHRLAAAAIALDGIYPQLSALAADVDELRDDKHGSLWLPRLSAVKHRATETAKYVVEEAVRSCGGQSYFNSNELSRLYRDVLAGIFHPSDAESLHGAWANAVLGPVR